VDYRYSWTYLLGMNDTHITKLVYEEEAIQKAAFTLLLMVMRGRCSWLKIVLTDPPSVLTVLNLQIRVLSS